MTLGQKGKQTLEFAPGDRDPSWAMYELDCIRLKQLSPSVSGKVCQLLSNVRGRREVQAEEGSKRYCTPRSAFLPRREGEKTVLFALQ